MVITRRLPPYWRRTAPRAIYDIAKLKPASLLSGQRFETPSDARKESKRSERVLTAYCPDNCFSTFLRECRDGDYHCERTYCPKCARVFRRHAIGQLLRLNSDAREAVHFLVVLLERSRRGDILNLMIEPYRHSLRKRLERAGLADVAVIGGFEMVYRAKAKEWVLHVNLVFFGGGRVAIDHFKNGFPDANSVREDGINDPVKQLSYVLKFTTYHRPHEQRGVKKSRAKSLNRAEHFELVEWMSQYDFVDHLFMCNARRRGTSIELSSNVARKA
jgi:hypothetical protein